MFKVFHALKQVKPPVLSVALVETVQKTAQTLDIDAQIILQKPLLDTVLPDWQHAIIIFNQSLTSPTVLLLPENKSLLEATLKTLLHTLNQLKILSPKELPDSEIKFDTAEFNRQISLPIAPPEPVFQHFFTTATDLLVIYNFPDFSWRSINASFRRFLHMDDEEKLPVDWLDLIHPEDRPKTFDALGILLEEKQSAVEFENQLKVGISPKSIYKRVCWRLFKQNDFVYMSGASQRHEKSQVQENTATLFHELRNLVSGILGNAQLMYLDMEHLIKNLIKYGKASDMQLDLSALTQYLQAFNEGLIIIEDCGNDQLVLLNNVLDFNKLEQGNVQLESKPFVIRHDVVNPLINICSPLCQKKSIKLSTFLPPDDQWLEGDAHRIKEVLLNLLTNAIKFAEPVAGKPAIIELSLSLSAAQNLKQLHFRIKNSSKKGLTPTQISQLFKPYTQSDPSITRLHGGTGLGLVVCKQLLQLMNGHVVCDSSMSEQWVQFDVSMALPIAPEIIPTKGKRQRPSLTIKPALHAKVLVVEDSIINQNIIMKMLRKFQCTIEIAKNGQEAVDLYSSGNYDVILMDIQMPVMDGLTATRQIRVLEEKTGLKTPIIGLSGNAFTLQQKEAQEAGMDDYLTKPVQLPDLQEKLTKYRRAFPASTDASPGASSSDEKQPGKVSHLSLFTPRQLTLSQEKTITSTSSYSPSDVTPDGRSPLLTDSKKSHAGQNNHKITSSQERTEKLELTLQISPPSQREAVNDQTPPVLLDFTESDSPIDNPSPLRPRPLLGQLPESSSAPLLSAPISSQNKYFPNLSLFNPVTTEDKGTGNPIKKARIILQTIEYYFRAALKDKNFSSSSCGELKGCIIRLKHCYQTASLNQQWLITTATLGCWQSLYNQVSEKTQLNAVDSYLLETASFNLGSWQRQADLFEENEPSIEAQRMTCCLIS